MLGARVVIVGMGMVALTAFVGLASLGGLAGAIAVDVQENGPLVPPELEALYRQVEQETGVPWVALAAWDGAEFRFQLPVPVIGAIYERRITAERERRRRAAEEWCELHPEDEGRCPPQEPALTPDEEVAVWRYAVASWRSVQKEHIRTRAGLLRPHVEELERSPLAVYRRFLGQAEANRAAELLDGYLILEALEAHEE